MLPPGHLLSIFQEIFMALIFPRLARNFIKNGYFPTDSDTLGRLSNFLAPSDGPLRDKSI